MARKKDGFTLMETLVVVMVVGILLTIMLSLVTTSARTMKSVESDLGQKSQYQRAVSFISNTVRRNQKSGAVKTYNDGKRVVIALADSPGNNLHYYIDGDELLMYIGSEAENLPVLSDSDKKEKTMVLAKDMESILFEFESGTISSKENLRVKYSVYNEDGTTSIHTDRINIYVTN